MNTYTCASGETISYPDPAPDVAAFLARVRSAAADPVVDPNQLIELIYGVENPLLDKEILPGRAMVTKAVFANPVYHIMSDLLFRKELAARNQAPEVVAATYTVSVKDAARQLGITEASVRAAISARKLDAWMRNGQWYLRPAGLAAYKVSNRGRKKRKRPATELPSATHAPRNGTKPAAKPKSKSK